MCEEILRYEGTVTQSLNSGVMALFGAPVAHEDHAQRAVHAALAVQRAFIARGDEGTRSMAARADASGDANATVGVTTSSSTGTRSFVLTEIARGALIVCTEKANER